MEDKPFHLRSTAPPVPASETPSSVGDVDATVPTSLPGPPIPLSVRAEKGDISHSHTAVHHDHPESLLQPAHLSGAGMQTIQPSALTAGGSEEAQPGSVRLGPAEFVVTLPMDSRVKDDYERVLTNAAATMRKFIATPNGDFQTPGRERDSLLLEIYEIISRLNNVAIHPDLNIAHHLTAMEPDLEKQAAWAEYSSTKFLLLSHLIELASTHELHVILAVQDEKKQEIVEKYLQGKGFTYTRPRSELGGNLEVSLIKGSLSFGVHSNDGVRELFRAPSAILALDTAFNSQSPSMEHIRTTFTRNGGLLPVIWFIVSNTCEHIERCLPELQEIDRLRLLLQYTVRLHDEVGDLQDDALGVPEHAEEVLNYMLHNFAAWQVPPIEPLHFMSSEELESSTSSSDESQGPAQKRALPEDDQDDYTVKRAKVDEPETSQLTQSTKVSSQSLDHELQSLEKSLVQMKVTHAAEKEALQEKYDKVYQRCWEIHGSIGPLQTRYEDRTRELAKTREERDSFANDKISLEQRAEKFRDDVAKLKEERSKLQVELQEAREEIKNGGGTLGDLEMAREEIRRLNQEAESLRQKADYARNQSEYARDQYQNASNAAAQAGNELRQLQSENKELRHKAENNAVRLRKINIANDIEIHLARIAELELTVASRDELLRKKEEELREIRKNRPSTRSTSTQPRSPKWAASSRPTSPGVNNGNGNGNNGLAGRGSALRFSEATF